MISARSGAPLCLYGGKDNDNARLAKRISLKKRKTGCIPFPLPAGNPVHCVVFSFPQAWKALAAIWHSSIAGAVYTISDGGCADDGGVLANGGVVLRTHACAGKFACTWEEVSSRMPASSRTGGRGRAAGGLSRPVRARRPWRLGQEVAASLNRLILKKVSYLLCSRGRHVINGGNLLFFNRKSGAGTKVE